MAVVGRWSLTETNLKMVSDMKNEVTKKSALPYKDAFFKSVLGKFHGNL